MGGKATMSMRVKISTRKITGKDGREHTFDIYAVMGRDYHYQIYLDDKFWCTAESGCEADEEIEDAIAKVLTRMAS